MSKKSKDNTPNNLEEAVVLLQNNLDKINDLVRESQECNQRSAPESTRCIGACFNDGDRRRCPRKSVDKGYCRSHAKICRKLTFLYHNLEVLEEYGYMREITGTIRAFVSKSFLFKDDKKDTDAVYRNLNRAALEATTIYRGDIRTDLIDRFVRENRDQINTAIYSRLGNRFDYMRYILAYSIIAKLRHTSMIYCYYDTSDYNHITITIAQLMIAKAGMGGLYNMSMEEILAVVRSFIRNRDIIRDYMSRIEYTMLLTSANVFNEEDRYLLKFIQDMPDVVFRHSSIVHNVGSPMDIGYTADIEGFSFLDAFLEKPRMEESEFRGRKMDPKKIGEYDTFNYMKSVVEGNTFGSIGEFDSYVRGLVGRIRPAVPLGQVQLVKEQLPKDKYKEAEILRTATYTSSGMLTKMPEHNIGTVAPSSVQVNESVATQYPSFKPRTEPTMFEYTPGSQFGVYREVKPPSYQQGPSSSSSYPSYQQGPSSSSSYQQGPTYYPSLYSKYK